MKTKLVTIITIGLIMSGCAKPVHHMQAMYLEQEHERYAQKGHSSISGQVFLKTRGGEVRYGAGEIVRLFPATPYVSEMFNSILRGEQPTNIDSKLKKIIKETVADGMGNYEFNDLPAGEYLLQSQVFWQVPTGAYTTSTTGGDVTNNAKVTENDHIKVMLTK